MTARSGGYTLLETLIVLAILGLLVAVATPAMLTSIGPEATLGEELAGLFRHAEQVAIRGGSATTLFMDPGTGRWSLERPDGSDTTGAVRLDRFRLAAEGGRVVARFEPTGQSEGALIQVWNGERMAVVRAERWTGRIHVEEP